MTASVARPWRTALFGLLRLDRFAQPDELPMIVSAAVAPLGVDITIYVVDQEQRLLRRVPRLGQPAGAPLVIDTTIAGRAFMSLEARSIAREGPEPARLWLPLLDGTERLGVLEVVPTDPTVDLDDPEFRTQCGIFAGLIGHLYTAKVPYGDTLVRARRTRRMSEASELVLQLLPPLTYICHRVAISAILEPCYTVGGDGFDYAVDGSAAYFAIFDSAGHDLRSGLSTATVLSAIRAARRTGADLIAMAQAADRALAEYAPDLRYTTAVLGQLDLDSGRVRYVNAGHPAPLVLRRGRTVGRLDGGRRMPLGVEDPRVEVGLQTLEPGDRLVLFSDGVTEARGTDGRQFGEHRLAELVQRHCAAGFPAPETLRRLAHAALAHYAGPPDDDATLLMLEWTPTPLDQRTVIS